MLETSSSAFGSGEEHERHGRARTKARTGRGARILAILYRRLHGQSEAEARPRAAVHELDSAPVVLDEPSRHGEAEAGAALLAVGDEGLEEAVPDDRGYAGPLVAQDELEVPVLDLGLHVQPPGSAHGVPRVGREVAHGALQLVDVQEGLGAARDPNVCGDLE